MGTPNNIRIGQTVAGIRKARKMTTLDLANALGLRRSQVVAVEDGVNRLFAADLPSYAVALACSVEDLLVGVTVPDHVR